MIFISDNNNEVQNINITENVCVFDDWNDVFLLDPKYKKKKLKN